MTFHEWHDRDEAAGERRYFRAGKFGKQWHVKTTLKSDPDWEELAPVPRDVLEALRTQLLNKYQRRRIPYEDVVAIDKMVVEAGGETVIEELEK
jgi:transposase-like protein